MARKSKIPMEPKWEESILEALRAGDSTLTKWSKAEVGRPGPYAVMVYKTKNPNFKKLYLEAQEEGFINYADNVMKRIEAFDAAQFSKKCAARVARIFKKNGKFLNLDTDTQNEFLQILEENSNDNKYIHAEQNNLTLLWRSSCWYLSKRFRKGGFGEQIDVNQTIKDERSKDIDTINAEVAEYESKFKKPDKDAVH